MENLLTQLNPRDAFLVTRIGQKFDDRDAIQRVTRTLLDEVAKKSPDETGLTAVLLATYFKDKLTPDQCEQIEALVRKTRNDSEIVRTVIISMQTLETEVRGFYMSELRPQDHYLAASLDNPMANTLINLRALSLEEEFSQKGYLIEHRVDPNGMIDLLMNVE